MKDEVNLCLTWGAHRQTDKKSTKESKVRYCTILNDLDRGMTCDPFVQIFSFEHLPNLV